MTSLEQQIKDAFEVQFSTAKTKGPAVDFLSAEEGARTDEVLAKSVALTEYAMLERRGMNPYRADMVEKMEEADFYRGVDANELEATRHLLGLVQSMRRKARADIATVKLTAALKVANKVEGATIVAPEIIYGVEEEAEEKSAGK